MKIVRPYMKMLTTGMQCVSQDSKNLTGTSVTAKWGLKGDLVETPLDFVNWCARISHRAENAEKQDVERFLRSVVIDHGDWSVTEHVSISVDAVVDRGITHEIVRHRLGAYTQESTRFVNYAKKMAPSFIYPKVDVECDRCLCGEDDGPKYNEALSYATNDPSWQHKDGSRCLYHYGWLNAIDKSEYWYRSLLNDGWRPQEARSVFPNALAARIVITYNLRMWRHFFLMRTTMEAHPQMRQVTIPLLAEFQKAIPVLFEDITPNSKQSYNMSKAR